MKTKRTAIVIQIIFWTLLTAFQASMATNIFELKIAIAFSLINTSLGMIVYYINMLWSFPKFYATRNYTLYFIISFSLIIALSIFFFHFDHKIVTRFRITAPIKEFKPLFHFMRAFSWLCFIYVISLIFSLIRLLQIQEQKEKELAEQKLNTEIRLLKAQISPHFIFNALNNIYSLTYSKSAQAPDSILKLSQMLRYVFYECNKDEVPIRSEIEYIQNFIGFQQMKSPHEQSINLNTEDVDETFRIAPMLLIPLVENSFKYSKIEDNKQTSVVIILSTNNDELIFNIRNNYPEQSAEAGSGMGIKNVKNRLMLTYPNKHSFELKDENNTFEVTLKIKRA